MSDVAFSEYSSQRRKVNGKIEIHLRNNYITVTLESYCFILLCYSKNPLHGLLSKTEKNMRVKVSSEVWMHELVTF